jgi:hypothetical protein
VLRHHDRRVVQETLELVGELVDCVGHEQIEVAGFGTQARRGGELLAATHEAFELVLRHRVPTGESHARPRDPEHQHQPAPDQHGHPLGAG